MKPINFYQHPVGSILKKSEAETVAKNIMRILQRTGNEWRKLTWEEYVEERKKDAADDVFGFSEKEKFFFDQVVDYCTSPEKAQEFCSDWYSNVPEGTQGTPDNLVTQKG